MQQRSDNVTAQISCGTFHNGVNGLSEFAPLVMTLNKHLLTLSRELIYPAPATVDLVRRYSRVIGWDTFVLTIRR